MDDTQPLVGDVKTQFVVINGDPHDLGPSITAARAEQEAMCGYPLVTKSWRHTETRNARGDIEIEVFATFAPAPVQTAEEIADVLAATGMG